MFGTALVAVVVISGDTRDSVTGAADELVERLGKHPDVVRDAFHRADIGFFEDHALMFASRETVQMVSDVVGAEDAELELIGDLEGLPQMIRMGLEKLENQKVPEDAKDEEVEQGFDFFDDVLNDIDSWFKEPERQSFGIIERLWQGSPSLQGNAGDAGYLLDNDGHKPRLAVIFVQPTNNSQAMEVVEPLTDLLRQEANAVAAKHKGTQALVTGMPALQTDELRLVTRDCLVAGIAAGLGVILVFVFAFRSIRVSIFLLFPLGVGLIWAAGFAGALYGHLTMITSYFAAVLFGLGVPFTIHIVSRFHEALREGKDRREAVEISLTKAGPGVLVGGITTAVAFLTIAFSEFKGFAEMGVISGVGVAFILLANLTTLPAALLLWHPGESAVAIKKPRGAMWVSLARSRIVIPVITGLVILAGAGTAYLIEFDYAVENMLPADSEAVTGIRLLDKRTDFSSTYSVSVAKSMDEAEALRKRLEALETVSRSEAISMFVPGGQAEKVKIISGIPAHNKRALKKSAVKLNKRLGSVGKSTAAELAEALQDMADMLEDLAFDAKKAGRKESVRLGRLAKKASAVSKTIAASKDDARAGQLERQVFEAMARGMKVMAAAVDDRGFGVDDMPQTIRGRYVSPDGKNFAVISYPNGDIGEKDFFFKHVDEMRAVDQEITGHPVTNKAFTLMVHRGFAQAIILSAFAVIILVLLDLRSLRGIVMALAPVVLAIGGSLLVMFLTGFKFNYGNLMALPILIGTGVDYGAHLAHRAKQEGCVRRAARTTGKAIALSGLTTLIGFGSLILGNHWGVRSLGLLLVLGILFSLIAALIVLPGMLSKRESVGASGDSKGV